MRGFMADWPAARTRLSGTLARWIVRRYPRAWRHRYQAEMEDLLDHQTIRLSTLADLAVGALDAHWHRNLLPTEVFTMAQRIRTSEVTIFIAFVVFIIPWALTQQMRDPLPLWEARTLVHPEIRLAYNGLQAAGAIATLALLAGGIPILFAALRQAWAARSGRGARLLLIPIVLTALLVGYSLVAQRWWTQHSAPTSQNLTPLALILQLGFFLMLLVTIVGSTWAVARAIDQSAISVRILRLALIPAAILTVALAAGLVTQSILTTLVLTEAPDLAGPPFGLAIFVALMGLALGLAISALWRGWRALRSDAGQAA